MNTSSYVQKSINIIIVGVWVVNGLFCKILNFVPRHQEIVARILGEPHAELLTKLIGISELMMAVWILTRIRPRLNALTQIFIIMLMNSIEFIFAPDLLLWGKMNVVFALLFAVVIYYNEFRTGKTVES